MGAGLQVGSYFKGTETYSRAEYSPLDSAVRRSMKLKVGETSLSRGVWTAGRLPVKLKMAQLVLNHPSEYYRTH